MKRNMFLFPVILALSSSFATACSSIAEDDTLPDGNNEVSATVTFSPDTESNLKNSYMGWTLYSETEGAINSNPTLYWTMQDEGTILTRNVFYLLVVNLIPIESCRSYAFNLFHRYIHIQYKCMPVFFFHKIWNQIQSHMGRCFKTVICIRTIRSALSRSIL